MPFKLAVGEQRIALFAVIATFGTAQEVTTDELRIETLFPADTEAEALFHQLPLPPVCPVMNSLRPFPAGSWSSRRKDKERTDDPARNRQDLHEGD